MTTSVTVSRVLDSGDTEWIATLRDRSIDAPLNTGANGTKDFVQELVDDGRITKPGKYTASWSDSEGDIRVRIHEVEKVETPRFRIAD